MTLTVERLRECFSYDPETGVLAWKVFRRRLPIGAAAGKVNHDGYRHIAIDGMRYSAHRMAWLYVHGVWPPGPIDHINGDRSDNRICNLRSVTKQENAQNLRRAHADNRSGLLGVSPQRNKWRATIKIDGKQTSLGSFSTPEEAHSAYLKAKRAMHPGCTL